VLVAIANWGTKNDQFLMQLVSEYRSMSFQVDIVVLSNLKKQVAPGVEVVVVDLSGKNPWSLPFAHKEIFASRIDEYDLFIYSEDDTLIKEKNLRAFLDVSAVLPENEIAGFLRFEEAGNGSLNFPEVHGHFHWQAESVRSAGEFVFASFSNAHSACYVLTREQLRRAVNSGGFLVGPHHGEYDLLCSAATDPYTQCGFQRVICISRIDDFLIHHLPNKYVGTRFGVDELELRRQLAALKQTANGHKPTTLFATETKLPDSAYSKDYYEPAREDLLNVIPNGANSILSIGCGWGAIEAALANRGHKVVAVPIDPIIPGKAGAAGVKIIHGDFRYAREKLAGERFDCLLLSNVLHLTRNPADVLTSFGSLLSDAGTIVILTPNIQTLRFYWNRIKGDARYQNYGGYEESGVQLTSQGDVRRWLRSAKFRPEKIVDVASPRSRTINRLTLGLAKPLLYSEFIVVAKKM